MLLTNKQLTIENEQLRSRLAEVEDTINAIRNGEVDAIMVSGTKGDQVYSVSSAETPYRTFIEEMSEGAVTLTKEGTILYCNPKFAEIVESPYEEVVGSPLKQFVIPEDNVKIDYFLAKVTHEKKRDVVIVTLNNTIYLRLSVHLLPLYLQGENYLLIATDISDLKRKENELKELISNLMQIIGGLRSLRIDNIDQTLDAEGKKNKLERINSSLFIQISKLKDLIEELREKQRAQVQEINVYYNIFP